MNKQPCDPQVGADVECFLIDEDYNVKPCVGLIAGTKDKPLQVPDYPKGYMVQEDNVMLEWNIPPQKTRKGLINTIIKAKRAARSVIPPGHSLMYMAAMKFTPEQLNSKQAQLIGCEPDYDAYEGGTLRGALPQLTDWRGAGGHIHLGGDFQCPDFVAALYADLSLGVNAGATGIYQTERDKWYGKPGIYRPKPYGIEWRSPSCQWVDDSDSIVCVSEVAIRLANWLTVTDARILQRTFNAINWTQVHAYLSHSKGIGDRHRERSQIIQAAKDAGVPL